MGSLFASVLAKALACLSTTIDFRQMVALKVVVRSRADYCLNDFRTFFVIY